MALIDAPEAATRLARAICSDVSLYNEEKIVRGIERDNFFDAMRDELQEGRELYRSRVSPEHKMMKLPLRSRASGSG